MASGVAVSGSLGIVACGCVENRFNQEETAALMRVLQHETSRFLTNAVVEQEGIALLEIDSDD